MTDLALRVNNLSKLYRIGPRERYKALRDTLTDALYAPFRALASVILPSSVVSPSSVVGLPSFVPGPPSPVVRHRGHRLSSRADRAREHLPEWRDSWDEKSGD
jgi:hypothetical protein